MEEHVKRSKPFIKYLGVMLSHLQGTLGLCGRCYPEYAHSFWCMRASLEGEAHQLTQILTGRNDDPSCCGGDFYRWKQSFRECSNPKMCGMQSVVPSAVFRRRVESKTAYEKAARREQFLT